MTFFSVDVETTSTNPFQGSLLTVGVCTVKNFEGNWGIDSTFYARIQGPFVWDDKGTQTWWDEQDEEVQYEAYGDSGERASYREVAEELQKWVESHLDDMAIFVANPVAFDKPWVDRMFYETGVVNPFHYRSLCLRSMKYGLVSDPTFGSDRTTHESQMPHHALFDARAQAYDLIDMLREKAIRENKSESS